VFEFSAAIRETLFRQELREVSCRSQYRLEDIADSQTGSFHVSFTPVSIYLWSSLRVVHSTKPHPIKVCVTHGIYCPRRVFDIPSD